MPGRVVTLCTLPRLEQEIEELENADALPAAAKESPAAPSPARTPAPAPAPAPRPAQEDQRAEAVLNSQQVRGSRGAALLAQIQTPSPPPGLWPVAYPNPSLATSQLCDLPALLCLPGPRFPRCAGASWGVSESAENRCFTGKGSFPACHPSHVHEPSRHQLSNPHNSPFRCEQRPH